MDIGVVLNGFGIHPLDHGSLPVSAFVLIKTVDENGAAGWSFRTTEPPNREELLGVLQVHVDLLRRELVDEWVPE